MRLLITTLIFTTTFLVNSTFCQKKEIVTINPNTNGNITLSDIPFDKKFILQIPSQEGLDSVTCIIEKVYPSKKTWQYHLLNDVDVKKVDVRFPKNPIHIELGPLHPNTAYKIELISKQRIDKKSLKKLEESVLSTIRKWYAKDTLLENDIDNFTQEIDANFKQVLQHSNIIDKNGKRKSYSDYKDLINQIKSEIYPNFKLLDTANDKMTVKLNALKQYVENIDINDWNEIGRKLFELKYNLIIKDLQEINQEILKKDFYYGINNKQQIKLEDACEFVSKIMDKNSSGKKRFLKVFEEKDNYAKVDLIYNLLKILTLNNFDFTAPPPSKYFTESEIKHLAAIFKRINEYIEPFDETLLYEQKQKNETKLLSGKFNDLYLERNDFFSHTQSIDLTSKKSPYVGIEVGIGYAPYLKRAVTYQGISFHLHPVDKSIPYSLDLYKNRDRIFKLTGLYLGIQQVLDGDEKKFTKLTSIGNPSAGIGFRFLKIFRGNIGGMVINQLDSNPISRIKTPKLTLTSTISLDLEFQDVIKGISRIIN